MRLLPSEKVFRVFEVCAAYRSFTLAADSLGITQSAVSQQIKMLENNLGVELFHRQGRQIVLSSAGRNILEAQKNAFGTIRQAAQRERAEKGGLEVSVQVLPGFSVRWLLPRLSAFEAAHPEVNLTILTEADGQNPRHPEADMLILYSSRNEKAWISGEFIFPVASPDFVDRNGLGDISRHALERKVQSLPLLGDSRPHALDLWDRWGAEHNIHIPMEHLRRYPQSNMSLQLSEYGQGIALGRTCLVVDAIAAGALVELPGFRVAANAGYLIKMNPQSVRTTGFSLFEQWITRAIQDSVNISSGEKNQSR